MYITLNVLMPILIYIYCEGQMKQKIIKLCLRVRYLQHVIGTSVVPAHHTNIIFLSTPVPGVDFEHLDQRTV